MDNQQLKKLLFHFAYLNYKVDNPVGNYLALIPQNLIQGRQICISFIHPNDLIMRLGIPTGK